MVCSFPRLTKSEEMAGQMHPTCVPPMEKGEDLGEWKVGNRRENHREMTSAGVELTTKDLCKGSQWSRRRTGTERKHNQQPGRETG